MKKNSIWFGLIIGICVPIVGYAVVMMIFEQLTEFGLVDHVSASTSGRRARTIGLFAICSLLIPIQIFRNRDMGEAIRGLAIPFAIYVGLWIYLYIGEIQMY